MTSKSKKAPSRQGPSRWMRGAIQAWVADQIEASTGVRPITDENDISLLTIDGVSNIVGLRKSAIYALIAKGRFPRQVRLRLLGEEAA